MILIREINTSLIINARYTTSINCFCNPWTKRYISSMQRRHLWFTLIEILISMVIIAWLSLLVFQIYKTTLFLSLKIQNEKVINNEVLFVMQTIQNLADRMSVDEVGYSGNLLATKGNTPTLLLTESWSFSQIGTSCLLWICSLVLQKDGKELYLTDPSQVSVRDVWFRVLPYRSSPSYVEQVHPGFWIMGTMQLKRPSDRPPYTTTMQFQNFFTLRQYK